MDPKCLEPFSDAFNCLLYRFVSTIMKTKAASYPRPLRLLELSANLGKGIGWKSGHTFRSKSIVHLLGCPMFAILWRFGIRSNRIDRQQADLA